jgi:2-iminobutanoate/2-iminopropanoate deaminase
MKPESVYPKGRALSKNPISPAVRYKDLLFVSGQVGRDADGTTPSGIKEQTTVTLRNLAAVLEAAGGTLADVVRCNCYLTNIGDFAGFNEVYRSFFTSDPLPARTTVEVSRLGGTDFLVEVDAIAVVPE